MSGALHRVKLGVLVEILSGFAFDSEQFGDTGNLPIVRIRDIVSGRSSTFFRGDYDPKYVLQDGDLLIGMDGEFNRARWNGGNALLNQRVCRISCSSHELDDAYLFHFLPAALKAIEAVTPFVTVKHLSVKNIRDIEIHLPPLTEQHRIAEILDRAEALRVKRLAAIDQLGTLTQAIFLDLFSNVDTESWPEPKIASLALNKPNAIRTGPFGSQLLHSEFVDSGIAVLGIDNAVQNKFVWARPRFITEKKYRQLQRYKVFPGDVLITIMGTCGRCAVVPDEIPTSINTKHLCCISLDQSRCLPLYLQACFLLHSKVQHRLGIRERGAVMPGLNMQIIKELRVPLPPLDLQREFARRVAAVEKLKAAYRASLAELDALFAALQHRAFSGEL